MKNTDQKNRNKSFGGFTRQQGELTKASGDITKHAGELTRASGDVTSASGELTSRSSEHTRRPGELTKAPGDKNPSVVLMNIILLALKTSNLDYLPHADGDFDEWQKNFVKHLSSPWPPVDAGVTAAAAPLPSVLLYVYLGIPVERYNAIIAEQLLWNKDFARGGKETDRRSSDAIAKQTTRNAYVKMLRALCKQYILYNDKTTDEIKRALKLTVPDTEPSPVHGTDAPEVGLKNAGGSVIEVRCRRDKDAKRASVLKGYQIEMRFMTGTQPTDPDMFGMKTELSGKAHFKLTAGMINLGKTFYCYARWRSKTDAKFNSPWTNLLQIVIA